MQEPLWLNLWILAWHEQKSRVNTFLGTAFRCLMLLIILSIFDRFQVKVFIVCRIIEYMVWFLSVEMIPRFKSHFNQFYHFFGRNFCWRCKPNPPSNPVKQQKKRKYFVYASLFKLNVLEIHQVYIKVVINSKIVYMYNDY